MSENRTHFLKTWPEYFDAIVSGEKRFELRKNDRDYRVGDRLDLAEFDPQGGHFTGREHTVQVTYVLQGGAFGLPEGYAVMSIAPVPTEQAGEPKPVVWISDTLVREAMLDAWNEICSDTGHHPLDITNVGRGRLEFSPRHWADLTAARLRALTLSSEGAKADAGWVKAAHPPKADPDVVRLVEAMNGVARVLEESAEADRVRTAQTRASSAGSAAAVTGYIFSATASESAAKQIRAALAPFSSKLWGGVINIHQAQAGPDLQEGKAP